MIARLWSARTTRDNAPRYAQHFRDEVLPVLRALAGYLGSTLLEAEDEDGVEITVISRWESLDCIRAFAGDHVDRAVVADAARALLIRCDERVRHAIVTHDDR